MSKLVNLIVSSVLALSSVCLAPSAGAAYWTYPYKRSAPPPKESCGLSELSGLSVASVLSSRTVVFQDTSYWNLYTSEDWCLSASGLHLKRGLLSDVTFMRKNDSVAFYLNTDSGFRAVKWSNVKDPDVQAEISALTKISVQWEIYYKAILNEANKRQ